MKLSVVERRIVQWYNAAVDTSKPDRVRCRYLKSPPGRGKTSVLVHGAKQISAALNKNIGYVVLSGPLLTPADMVGYLVPKHVVGADGSEHSESVFTDPFWFRTREGKRLDEYDGGIIIVDEADKMDTDCKKLIGEAALTGRLGPHAIPETWPVWMAGNRSQDRSGSTKELDHLINRRDEIEITDDLESLITWMDKNGVMPLTKAFTNQNPEIVFTPGVPKEQGSWCTPRSLVMADSMLQSYAGVVGGELGPIPDDQDTMEEVAGMVGQGAAAQYYAFVKLEREMPSFREIVKNPKGAKLPNKPDAQMLVCYNLAHRISKETADPVVEYVERMPKEFAVTFGAAACRRDFTLVETPAFQKWVQKNASLMASL